MHTLRKSIAQIFFSSNISLFVSFIGTLIVARYLSPNEIGVFSITVVFINIFAVIRDFGVSSYIQREKDLTAQKTAAAFGVLIAFSWTMAGAAYLTRHLLADFYGDPRIALVVEVLCISYTLVPFASFFYAMLARDLRADKQSVVNYISTLAFVATSVSLAYLGFSYLSLAWANVANIVTTILIYVLVAPRGTAVLPTFRGWREPLAWGSKSIGGPLLDKCGQSLPEMLLGKLSGATDVGLYSRANGLIGIFAQIATPAVVYNALPFISRSHHENAPIAPIIEKAAAYLTGLAWPAFVFLGVFSLESIRFLYGEKWGAAAPIAPVLAAEQAMLIGYSLSPVVLMAIGRPIVSAFCATAAIMTKLLAVALFGFSDLLHFALALAVGNVLSLGFTGWLMRKYVGYGFTAAARAYGASLKVALPCIAVALLVRTVLGPATHDVVILLVGGIAIVATWLVAVFRTRHPLAEEVRLIACKLPVLRRFV